MKKEGGNLPRGFLRHINYRMAAAVFNNESPGTATCAKCEQRTTRAYRASGVRPLRLRHPLLHRRIDLVAHSSEDLQLLVVGPVAAAGSSNGMDVRVNAPGQMRGQDWFTLSHTIRTWRTGTCSRAVVPRNLAKGMLYCAAGQDNQRLSD